MLFYFSGWVYSGTSPSLLLFLFSSFSYMCVCLCVYVYVCSLVAIYMYVRIASNDITNSFENEELLATTSTAWLLEFQKKAPNKNKQIEVRCLDASVA